MLMEEKKHRKGGTWQGHALQESYEGHISLGKYESKGKETWRVIPGEVRGVKKKSFHYMGNTRDYKEALEKARLKMYSN